MTCESCAKRPARKRIDGARLCDECAARADAAAEWLLGLIAAAVGRMK